MLKADRHEQKVAAALSILALILTAATNKLLYVINSRNAQGSTINLAQDERKVTYRRGGNNLTALATPVYYLGPLTNIG